MKVPAEESNEESVEESAQEPESDKESKELNSKEDDDIDDHLRDVRWRIMQAKDDVDDLFDQHCKEMKHRSHRWS